ncbi:dihydroxyacetone kinase subunit DhaL [Streptomyces sp. NBC_01754]|uniref:dihydroxyacetone kinase subunit DhaL n=1 Tax=Streptomyces sp. NBC_01754 TaxID=2975930 RepID=UPI002DDB64F0|nr:dihydroxyacetone kinase subunit DhaL [Streptomyces sp. NBC_01754]WSC95575.1 dihydroxyacetone kinase subunit DhaL [Streptomyces sp. NBC_01754]
MDRALAQSWLLAFEEEVHEEKDHLTTLDSAIGDGDHGVNLCRGLSGVRQWLEEGEVPDSPGGVLRESGALLRARVGGASGVLYGGAFSAMGTALPAAEADAAQVGDALAAGLDVIVRLGAAAPGDKTMVDAFTPALAAFRTACAGTGNLGETASAAASAAGAGAWSTIPMQARKGRASYLGHRSVGHMDPGAASTMLLFRSLARVASSVCARTSW